MKYAEKYGGSRANRKYIRSRSYIYFWRKRGCEDAATGRDSMLPSQSLFRVMRKLGMFPQKEKKKAYVPKSYQQMVNPGERIQVDVKVAPVVASRIQNCACSNIPPLIVLQTLLPDCLFRAIYILLR